MKREKIIRKKTINLGLTKNRYLGNLCIRGHEFEDTGKSVRYNGSTACVICDIGLKEAKEKKKYFGQEPPTGYRGRGGAKDLIVRETTKKRVCLSCDEEFLSADSGNRICNFCKGDDSRLVERRGYNSARVVSINLPGNLKRYKDELTKWT